MNTHTWNKGESSCELRGVTQHSFCKAPRKWEQVFVQVNMQEILMYYVDYAQSITIKALCLLFVLVAYYANPWYCS